jgi:chromosome partitioning protein
MRVVSFVTQKGGSGKSTTAASIAVAAFQQGRRVFMLELDRQGTLSNWADARQARDGRSSSGSTPPPSTRRSPR